MITLLHLIFNCQIVADDMPDKQRLMAIISLALCHAFLFRTVDRKLIRTVWNCYKRVYFYRRHGNAYQDIVVIVRDMSSPYITAIDILKRG